MVHAISERHDRIFDIIVRSYIETAEPVGSRTISRKSDLNLSPASIRNVMADLEEQGLLTHPHTSAGRIPTDKGYRYWVDSLMKPEELSEKEKDAIRAALAKVRTIEGMADKVSKIISELTESAALMYIKNLKRVSFLNHILDDLIEAQKLADFLEEEQTLFIDGAFRVLEQPEFHDLTNMRHLLHALDQKYALLEMFMKDMQEEGLHVHIGSENAPGDLRNVSLVAKDCSIGGVPIASVAALGPTRMRYPKVVAVVGFVADTVSDTVKKL